VGLGVVENIELQAAGGGRHATVHETGPGEREGGRAAFFFVVVSSSRGGGELWREGGREGGRGGE